MLTQPRSFVILAQMIKIFSVPTAGSIIAPMKALGTRRNHGSVVSCSTVTLAPAAVQKLSLSSGSGLKNIAPHSIAELHVLLPPLVKRVKKSGA